MKAKILLLAVMLGGFALYGCDSDDNKKTEASAKYQEALKAKHPNAQQISWEKKGDYFVAEFRRNNPQGEAESWFDLLAEWKMTVTEINYQSLPQAVINALKASPYAQWRIDDIKMVERNNMEVIYVIEVEQKTEEYDLYFTAAGVLVKAVPDKDENDGDKFISGQATAKIHVAINKRYPQARILDIEYEDKMIEVEIIDGIARREVFLSLDGAWLHTKTEIKVKDVPHKIFYILKESEFGAYPIDDVDFFETPDEEYYLFELEAEPEDILVKILTDGTIVALKP